MATQTIDATIFASSHPDIVKRTSLSGVIFSGLILLVGVLAFVSTFEMEDRSSTLSNTIPHLVREGEFIVCNICFKAVIANVARKEIDKST